MTRSSRRGPRKYRVRAYFPGFPTDTYEANSYSEKVLREDAFWRYIDKHDFPLQLFDERAPVPFVHIEEINA